MATDAKTLLSQANCFACYAASSFDLRLIRLALLVGIVNGTSSMATDPKSLLASAQCFACYAANPYMLELIEIGLLVQILQGGSVGGGSGIVFGAYGGAQPNFTPASGQGVAIDTSPGFTRLWIYVNGAWN